MMNRAFFIKTTGLHEPKQHAGCIIQPLKNIFVIILIVFVMGCKKDSVNNMPVNIDAVSLYWDHEVFGKEGRRFRFEFYGKQEFRNDYELLFEYSVDRNHITVRLKGITDKGKSQIFPTGSGLDSLSAPRGNFWIPEKLLPKGNYTFTLQLPNRTVQADMIADTDKVSLNIPDNRYFECAIRDVYPIPAHLLMGTIIYSGDQNAPDAAKFMDDLASLGLTKATVPDYPYRHLEVDAGGNAISSQWPENNYSVGFLYNMNKGFEEIFDLARRRFNSSALDIYLFSSQGDEARLSKADGITLVLNGEMVLGK